jgi:hypothetical protein
MLISGDVANFDLVCRALLTSELAEVFAAAPPASVVTASHRVVLALAKASGKAESSEQGAEPAVNRREVDGQACPICYEEMQGKTEIDLAGITFCDTCQNGLHVDCFQMCKYLPLLASVYFLTRFQGLESVPQPAFTAVHL